jgi:hypothetical protein
LWKFFHNYCRSYLREVRWNSIGMTPNQGVVICGAHLAYYVRRRTRAGAGGDSTQPTRRAWRLSSDRAAGVVEQLKRLAARFHVALANYESGRRAIQRLPQATS